MKRWTLVRYKPFHNNKRSFLQKTVEQQTNAHTQAMNAMAEMVRALQLDVRAAAESRFQTNEEYETWRRQMIQFLRGVSRVHRE